MKVLFLGWCKDGVHDKVWGIASIGEVPVKNIYSHGISLHEYLIFWGRRGSKLRYQVKRMREDKAQHLIYTKQEKGYKRYSLEEAQEICDHLPKDLFVLSLSAKQ